MKTLDSFSQKKFQGLSPASQLKALDKLTSSLDQALAAGDPAAELSAHIRQCVSWMARPCQDSAFRLAKELAAASTPQESGQAVQRFQASLGKTFKDTQLPARQQDGPRFADQLSLERAGQVVLILDNLRSAYNVGSIFRSAECLGLKELWLCGITATPDNPALAKTARGTAQRVDWRHFDETREALAQARSQGYTLCALETSPLATSVFTEKYSLPLALVLGNESLGLAEDVLRFCDRIVCLPVQGWKNSLNVAVACAICAYQIVFGLPLSNQGGKDA
ncbi:MAG: RNA methyltransferase [Candidatus Cloacimonetes bacterium]|nr:RNA methyltransferase [Candidatus Cloacimonadota bacterium]